MNEPLQVAFDINFLRTVLLEEEKWDDPAYLQLAKAAWQAIEEGRIEGWIAAFSLPIIFSQCETFYFNQYYNRTPNASRDAARKQARAKAYSDVRSCINVFESYPLNDDDIIDASNIVSRNVSCNDFEDNLQIVCAYAAGIRLIVTDNIRDFACAGLFGVTALTLTQLLNRIS